MGVVNRKFFARFARTPFLYSAPPFNKSWLRPCEGGHSFRLSSTWQRGLCRRREQERKFIRTRKIRHEAIRNYSQARVETSLRSELLRLKIWQCQIDTYTQYIHMRNTKQRVRMRKGAKDNGAGCAKAQCPTKSVTGNNS